MSGDYVDRDFIVTRGDMRIAMTIQMNADTLKFNRKSRFLIDEPGSGQEYAFALTKPLKIGNSYNNEGVLKFVLSETNSTDYDNFTLSIPDYYMYFDDYKIREETTDDDNDDDNDTEEVWI